VSIFFRSLSAMSDSVPLTTILFAAVRSTLQAFTLAGFGFLLARTGCIKDTSQLAQISMKLTIPCLLFVAVLDCTQDWSTVACPVITDTMRSSWPLLLLPIVNVLVGLGLGALILLVAPPADSFRRSTMVAVAFGNSTGLPITLLTVIHMAFHPSSELGLVDPVLYLSVYLLVYPILQWGVGGLLLRKPAAPSVPSSRAESPIGGSPTESPIGEPTTYVELHFPETPDIVSETPTPLPRAPRKLLPARWVLWLFYARHCAWDGITAFLKPPVIASLAGLFLALIPTLRGILVDLDGRNNDAPLQWAFNAAQVMGRAAVPLNMLILGASLAQGARWSAVRWQTNLLIAFAKLVVMPAVGIATVYLMRAILPDGTVSPALCLVTLMVTATPTANNVLVMVKVAGEDADAMSTCIFTQYALSPIFLTASVALFVYIAESI